MTPKEAQDRVKDGLSYFMIPKDLRAAMHVLSRMAVIAAPDENRDDAERWRELQRGLKDSGGDKGRFSHYISSGAGPIGEAVPQTVEANIEYKRLPVMELKIQWVNESGQMTLSQCIDEGIKRRTTAVVAT